MSKRLDLTYVKDIEKAARLTLEFVHGLTKEQFERDSMRQSAVLYQLAVIGEAAKQLSLEFRNLHPEVPWKKIIGMRNILVHAYRDADFSTIWDTIQDHLPVLLLKMQRLLS